MFELPDASDLEEIGPCEDMSRDWLWSYVETHCDDPATLGVVIKALQDECYQVRESAAMILTFGIEPSRDAEIRDALLVCLKREASFTSRIDEAILADALVTVGEIALPFMLTQWGKPPSDYVKRVSLLFLETYLSIPLAAGR
jgi:hypothetical protein